MKSRWRRPSSIWLNARVSRPSSSAERTGSACDRSPAATRVTPAVSARIGRVRRRAKRKPRISVPTRPERGGVDERGPKLVEPVEVDLDGVVDLDHDGHAPARSRIGAKAVIHVPRGLV